MIDCDAPPVYDPRYDLDLTNGKFSRPTGLQDLRASFKNATNRVGTHRI